MDEVPIRDLESLLNIAIKGRVCIQAWLGYAQVLFAGFGEEILPAVPPGGSHPLPTYELQTYLAKWRVVRNRDVIGTSDDERMVAEKAVEGLVGRRATAWMFVGSPAVLQIDLEGGLRLQIQPMLDEETLTKDAWSVRTPGGYHHVVRCDGVAYRDREQLLQAHDD